MIRSKLGEVNLDQSATVMYHHQNSISLFCHPQFSVYFIEFFPFFGSNLLLLWHNKEKVEIDNTKQTR